MTTPKDIPNINGRIDTRRDTPTRRAKMRVYRSARWQSFRLVMLSKYPVCQAEGCNRLSAHVDHLTEDYNDWREVVFQCLCASCHSRKTRREQRPD